MRIDSRVGIGLLDYRTGARRIEQRLHTLILSPDETMAIALPYLEPVGMTTMPERQVVRHSLNGGVPEERILRDLRALPLPSDPESGNRETRATVNALLSGLGATFCPDGSAYAVSVLGNLELRRSSDDAILATAHVVKDRAPSFTRSGHHRVPQPL